MECERPECDAEAAVRLHVPWGENESVCPSHARGASTRDGIVAEPLDGADGEWP